MTSVKKTHSLREAKVGNNLAYSSIARIQKINWLCFSSVISVISVFKKYNHRTTKIKINNPLNCYNTGFNFTLQKHDKY